MCSKLLTLVVKSDTECSTNKRRAVVEISRGTVLFTGSVHCELVYEYIDRSGENFVLAIIMLMYDNLMYSHTFSYTDYHFFKVQFSTKIFYSLYVRAPCGIVHLRCLQL